MLKIRDPVQKPHPSLAKHLFHRLKIEQTEVIGPVVIPLFAVRRNISLAIIKWNKQEKCFVSPLFDGFWGTRPLVDELAISDASRLATIACPVCVCPQSLGCSLLRESYKEAQLDQFGRA
jgi:hypothetical protein